MEIQHLQYFQTVARLGHITKAAEQLNISQPALSKSISLLERKLGVSLFDRNGHRIQLNYIGKTFLKRVDAILYQLDFAEKEVKDIAGEALSPVKLNVCAASNLLPDLLGSFRKIHPAISFHLSQDEHTKPDSDFDLGITATVFPSKAPNHILLLHEEIFIGVAGSHPLASRSDIYFHEAADEDFINLRQGDTFRDITDIYCTYANFSPRIAYECSYPITCLELIRGGHGLGFISGKSLKLPSDDSVKLLRIKDFKCERYLEMYWPPHKYISTSTRIFIEFVQDYFKEKFPDEGTQKTGSF